VSGYNATLIGQKVGMGGAGYHSQREVTTTPATLTVSDYIVQVNVAGPAQVTLPANAGVGDCVRIKDASNAAAANPITVLPAGSDTIDGGAAYVLNVSGGCVHLHRKSATAWETL